MLDYSGPILKLRRSAATAGAVRMENEPNQCCQGVLDCVLRVSNFDTIDVILVSST